MESFEEMFTRYFGRVYRFALSLTRRTPVEAIRWGTEDDYVTLYTSGDVVPTFTELRD